MYRRPYATKGWRDRDRVHLDVFVYILYVPFSSLEIFKSTRQNTKKYENGDYKDYRLAVSILLFNN